MKEQKKKIIIAYKIGIMEWFLDVNDKQRRGKIMKE